LYSGPTNKNNIRLLIQDQYLKAMMLIDEEIASVIGRVTLLIDGWTSPNIEEYIAVFISYLSNTENGLKNQSKIVTNYTNSISLK
jgi:hypothetical protein